MDRALPGNTLMASPDTGDGVRSDAAVADAMPSLSSETLFAGHREIRVSHGIEEYRLRLTRNNKLILTK